MRLKLTQAVMLEFLERAKTRPESCVDRIRMAIIIAKEDNQYINTVVIGIENPLREGEPHLDFLFRRELGQTFLDLRKRYVGKSVLEVSSKRVEIQGIPRAVAIRIAGMAPMRLDKVVEIAGHPELADRSLVDLGFEAERTVLRLDDAWIDTSTDDYPDDAEGWKRLAEGKTT